jgi:hypothetical protein
MRLVALLVAGLAAAIVTAGGAAGARSATAVIRPGVGIGPIRLGMSSAQVRRALGRPAYARGSRAGFDRLLIEYSYWPDGYTVHLLRRAGRTRVVSVETTLRTQRTRGGLGVGTSARRLAKELPGARCRELRPPPTPPSTLPTWRPACVLTSSRGTETVFHFGHPAVVPDPRDWPGDYPLFVTWVEVREPSP